MSLLKRRIFLCLIGICAGLGAWSVAEMILCFQVDFPSYLVFTLSLGGVFGGIMGGFFGSSDGIIMSNKYRIRTGIIHGILFGALGGVLGFLTGQAVLFIAGEYLLHSMKEFNRIGLPVSRALGWSLLGLFAGVAEGIRARSVEKIRVGIIGGLSGGLLGGLALEYARIIFPDIMLARLTGLLILGVCIGIMYGFAEARLSFGVFTLLNGRYKGKDFLVNQRRLDVGDSDSCDIVLKGYREVNPMHAKVHVKKDEVFIKSSGDGRAPLFVNDYKISSHRLKIGDVIKIGTAKLLYHYK